MVACLSQGTQVNTWEGSKYFEKASIVVDDQANTITLSGRIPGISSQSIIYFSTYDYNPGGSKQKDTGVIGTLQPSAPSGPTLSQSPPSGPPGTLFHHVGQRFTSGSVVYLHIRQPDGTELPVKSVNTGAKGIFSTTQSTSSTWAAGRYTVWVEDNYTGKKSNEVSMTITSPTTPVISHYPPEVEVQTWIDFSGTGFTPNTVATLHLSNPNTLRDNTDAETISVPVGADGKFRNSYRVPIESPAGTHSWYAEDTASAKTTAPSSYVVKSTGTATLSGFSITKPDGSKIGDQSVNESFDIKITALNGNRTVNNTFNGEVSILSSSGEVYPKGKIKLANGVATISIKLDEKGEAMLHCQNGSAFGRSNIFTVNSFKTCNN